MEGLEWLEQRVIEESFRSTVASKYLSPASPERQVDWKTVWNYAHCMQHRRARKPELWAARNPLSLLVPGPPSHRKALPDFIRIPEEAMAVMLRRRNTGSSCQNTQGTVITASLPDTGTRTWSLGKLASSRSQEKPRGELNSCLLYPHHDKGNPSLVSDPAHCKTLTPGIFVQGGRKSPVCVGVCGGVCGCVCVCTLYLCKRQRCSLTRKCTGADLQHTAQLGSL